MDDNDKIIAKLKRMGLVGKIWPVFRSDPSPPVFALIVPRRLAADEIGMADAELKRLLKANDIADYGDPQEAALLKDARNRRGAA